MTGCILSSSFFYVSQGARNLEVAQPGHLHDTGLGLTQVALAVRAKTCLCWGRSGMPSRMISRDRVIPLHSQRHVLHRRRAYHSCKAEEDQLADPCESGAVNGSCPMPMGLCG